MRNRLLFAWRERLTSVSTTSDRFIECDIFCRKCNTVRIWICGARSQSKSPGLNAASADARIHLKKSVYNVYSVVVWRNGRFRRQILSRIWFFVLSRNPQVSDARATTGSRASIEICTRWCKLDWKLWLLSKIYTYKRLMVRQIQRGHYGCLKIFLRTWALWNASSANYPKRLKKNRSRINL